MTVIANPGEIIYNRYMLKRIIAFFIVMVMALSFFGCGSGGQKISFDVVVNYFNRVSAMDFSSAYECFWQYGSTPPLDDYTASYEYAVKTLGITSISFSEPEYTKLSDTQYDVSAELTYTSSLAGEVTLPFEAFVVLDDDGIYIDYNDNVILPDYQNGDIISYITLTGQRGEILTSDHVAIATNSYGDTVYLDVPATVDASDSISRLASLLKLDSDDAVSIKKSFEEAESKNYGRVVVKAYARNSIDEELESRILEINGAAIDRSSLTPQRYYPYPGVYSHITGYVGSQTEEDVKKSEELGRSVTAQIGKSGIELSKNDVLMGTDGYAVRLYSSDGQFKSTIFSKSAQNGSDVVLTVDSSAQNLAFYLLAENASSEQTAVAIVMDTNSGAVEAMANYPSYDTNAFNYPISQEDLEAMPLFPNSTQGLYPPGSLLKPFTAMPALEDGLADMDTLFPYENEIVDNQWTPSTEAWPWEPITRDEKPKGEMNMTNAIKSSDNIYFGWLALQMGAERFCSFMESIGIGEQMPFDLPVAKSNLINDTTTMDRKLLTDMSFGQGEILLSPIQLASMYSAFSNGGNMIQPRIIDGVFTDSDGSYTATTQSEPGSFKTEITSQEIIDKLLPALREVVATGTAAAIKSDGLTLAAKTGTALKGSDKTKESSWVIAWYDGMDKNKLVLVLVDGPRTEGTYKLSVAKELLKAGAVDTPVITDAPASSDTTPSPSSKI